MLALTLAVVLTSSSLAGQARVTPSQQAERTSSPVILMPGFMGWHRLSPFGAYFMGSEAALSQEGVDVFALAPPPIADSETRARYLMKSIDAVLRRTGAEKVMIIAHSQGGVDTRVALANGYASKISVVTTLSSPHDGTEIADAALALPRGVVVAALDYVSMVWQSEQHIKHTQPGAEAVLVNLSRGGMKQLNAKLPATVDVPFFSVAAFSGGGLRSAEASAALDNACQGGRWATPKKRDALHPFFVPGSLMIWSVAGDIANDGVVPTRSQRFGTFLGCVAGDHVDWMGWGDHWFGDRSDEGWMQLDSTAFIVELWRGMRAVERAGDANTMDAHVEQLAKLANTTVDVSALAKR